MSAAQEQKLCLLVLIGLPGSGKTTISSFLVHHLETSGCINDFPYHCIMHICYDKIICPSNNVEWNEARRNVVQNVNNIVEELKNNLDSEILKKYNLKILKHKMLSEHPKRILIIVDDNMYYRSMRYRYYQLAREHQLSYCQLYLNCNVEECLNRNFQRILKEQIPEHVVRNMSANLEEPNAYINSWEVFSSTISSGQPFSLLSLANFFMTVDKAFLHPVIPVPQNLEKEHSENNCSSNLIHLADVTLRKIIGSTIKENLQILPQKQIQHLSVSLNKKKQYLLQQLKLGKIEPPEEVRRDIEKGNTCAMTALNSFFSEYFIKEN